MDLHPALDHVRGVLLDLDETLYTSGRALAVAEKLAAMGFPADETSIVSPPHMAGS